MALKESAEGSEGTDNGNATSKGLVRDPTKKMENFVIFDRVDFF